MKIFSVHQPLAKYGAIDLSGGLCKILKQPNLARSTGLFLVLCSYGLCEANTPSTSCERGNEFES